MPLTLDALPEEMRADLCEKLGIKTKAPTRSVKFSQEQVRQHAIRCLAPLAGLDKSARERVLKHALRMNDV